MVLWLLLGLFIGLITGILLGGMAIKLKASRQLIEMLTKQNGGRHDDR